MSKKRRDGVCVSSQEPYIMLLPYIMRDRVGAQVYYQFKVNIDNLRKYIHARRREGESISLFNVVIAAATQSVAKFPKANRFVAGRHIYQRNRFEISYMMKRELTTASEELAVRLTLEPSDTIADIERKMTEFMESHRDKETGKKSMDEILSAILLKAPRFAISAFVGLIRWLDFHGMAPQSLIGDLPFWVSLYVTNLGSLGMGAPVHHLYDLGNCSLFLSMGRADKEIVYDSEGKPRNSLSVSFAIAVDERIVDGYYFSRVIDTFERFMQNPETIDKSAAANAGKKFVDFTKKPV